MQHYKLDLLLAFCQQHPVFHVTLQKLVLQVSSAPTKGLDDPGKQDHSLSKGGYEVECTVAERKKDSIIKWLGCNASKDSWIVK